MVARQQQRRVRAGARAARTEPKLSVKRSAPRTAQNAASSTASKRGQLGEFQAIDRLRRWLEPVAATEDALELGIGDDAAVLHWGRKSMVCSVDASCEGVHFDLRWLTLEQAAARAFEAAASDLAAMGASPVVALVNLEVPRTARPVDFDAIGRGQARAGSRLHCPIIGGNIVRGERWAFTSTVLGSAQRVLLRSGAKDGDEIWLAGAAGLAHAGLELFRRDVSQAELPARLRSVGRRARRAWQEPQARIDWGIALVSRAHALIDMSDGLASELRHLASASGVKLTLDAEALTTFAEPDLAELFHWLELPFLESVLNGGEDYALLATGPSHLRPTWAHPIGEVSAGRGAFLRSGTRRVALRAGFDHLIETKRGTRSSRSSTRSARG